MNNKPRLHKIIAPLALGIGLTLGANAPAISYPRYSDSSSNYHRRAFIDIQPFRSLNVTPRYYTPLPSSRYRYDNYHHEYDSDNHRQRRVYRRGIRKPVSSKKSQNYNRDSNYYIRIRIR